MECQEKDNLEDIWRPEPSSQPEMREGAEENNLRTKMKIRLIQEIMKTGKQR